LSVGGQDNVRDEVPVSLKSFVRDAIVGIILGEFPDNNGLVTGRRENHVGKHGSGRDLSDPPIVSLQSTAKSQLFRHSLDLRLLKNL